MLRGVLETLVLKGEPKAEPVASSIVQTPPVQTPLEGDAGSPPSASESAPVSEAGAQDEPPGEHPQP